MSGLAHLPLGRVAQFEAKALAADEHRLKRIGFYGVDRRLTMLFEILQQLLSSGRTESPRAPLGI